MSPNPCPSTWKTLLPLLCAVVLPAQADPLLVQSSGTFTLETPVTSFSAPGASWTLSFIVDRHPALSPDDDMVRVGINTGPLFRDFSYRVDGVAMPQASYAVFWAPEQYGGMDLIFGEIPVGTPYGYDALIFKGASYYSGSELAPTIEPGSYTTYDPPYTGMFVATLGIFYEQPATVLTISPVPLPPSAAMMLGGLALLAGVNRRKTASRSLAR